MSQGQTEINEGRADDGTGQSNASQTGSEAAARPTASQMKWLRRGLKQAGGKLPLFDELGRKVGDRTVHSCIEHGWAEPWFNNPLKPDWQVCKLTEAGRRVASGSDA